MRHGRDHARAEGGAARGGHPARNEQGAVGVSLWPSGRGVLLGLAATALLMAPLVGYGAGEPGSEAPPTKEALAAALRAADESIDAGKPGIAIQQLTALGPVRLVEDHRIYLLVRAHGAAGQHAEVVAAGSAFAKEHARSPLRGAMAERVGDAQAALGHEAPARTAWADAAHRSDDDDAKAALLALQARSYKREGARPDAAAVWLEIWRTLPHTLQSREADSALDRLEPAPGALRSPALRAERAKILKEKRHNEPALAEADRVLAASVSDDLALEMRELRAALLFRLRRYPDAVRAFEALGNDPDARFWRARSLARSGRIDASIAAFLAVAQSEGGALGARSRFLAATLHEGEDRYAEARALYSQVAEGAPRLSQRRTARWRLGWMAYRLGEHAEAAELLGALARNTKSPLDALRPRYWQARAAALADPGTSSDPLRALAVEMPFTYYGLRAVQRVGPVPPRGPGSPIPPPTLRADRLERVEVLLAAGLVDEVRIELPGFVRKARSLGDRRALAELLADAGEYHDAERLIVDTEREELARGLDPARRALWTHAWPRAFEPEVEAASSAAGIPSALLLAVMREESGFRPKVLSSVGARGLVQIMPDTGAGLARLLSWPVFDPDQLFDPADNLTLGARYLRNLLDLFDGRAASAVAAYNAGENAVARWLKQQGGLEEDEWVEAIPYDQTRAYVRRVLRSLHVYRSLYGDEPGAAAGKGRTDGAVALEVQ